MADAQMTLLEVLRGMLGGISNPIHVPGCVEGARYSVCRGHRYVCHGCRRWCGWCFGAADEFPELCDDCAGPKLDLLDRAIATERAKGET